MSERWVFVGNPGVGKSTLLNCLAQRAAFKSGISYGGGITRGVQTWVDRDAGVEYVDTPGLADLTAERAAADEITRALRTYGQRIKLCFVMQLHAGGGVVGQDLVTMERVLDSIRVRDVPFAIIVNCASKNVCTKLVSDPEEVRRLLTLVNSGKYTTSHLLVVPEIKDLVEASNGVVPAPHGMRRGMEQFPTTSIPAHKVDAIVVADYSAAVQRTKRSVAALEKDKQAMAKKQQELGRKRVDVGRIAVGVLGALATIAQILIGVGIGA